MRWRVLSASAVMVTLVLTGGVRAEITSITGSASVAIQEYRAGQAGDVDQASGSYPETTSELPVQVVARLDSGEEAAAAAAAQLADPRDLDQPNPEEFAINLALLSASEQIRYSATATTQEARAITFAPREFPGRAAGSTVLLHGRLYIHGTLAVFSPTAGRDLSGAGVTLRVTVVQEVPDRDDRTVFAGTVGLRGGPDGAVASFADGQFPTATLIRSDLSPYIEDFEIFQVLTLPRLAINYSYSATIGEPFSLRATLTAEAVNVEDEVGVAALIGAPVDMIQEVLAAVAGEPAASKTVSALTQERDDPSGQLAFSRTAGPLLFPCGPLSLEMVCGLTALMGWRRLGRRAG